jgi:hypothetical protein
MISAVLWQHAAYCAIKNARYNIKKNIVVLSKIEEKIELLRHHQLLKNVSQ